MIRLQNILYKRSIIVVLKFFCLPIMLLLCTNACAKYTCSIGSANLLTFGNLNPYDYSTKTTTLTVRVKCTNIDSTSNVSYSLAFDAGKNSKTTQNRVMVRAKNKLSYNIYSSTLQILGNGLNDKLTNSYTLIGAGNSQTDTFQVSGTIPVQPLAIPGTYNDRITVTLTY